MISMLPDTRIRGSALVNRGTICRNLPHAASAYLALALAAGPLWAQAADKVSPPPAAPSALRSVAEYFPADFARDGPLCATKAWLGLPFSFSWRSSPFR